MGNLGHLGNRRGPCAAGWDMGGKERGKEGGKSDGDGTGLAPLRGGLGEKRGFSTQGDTLVAGGSAGTGGTFKGREVRGVPCKDLWG